MLFDLLKALVTAIPSFGEWLAGILDGDDKDPELTQRVREILPARGASRAAAENLSRNE